jgi:group I intron endonuclease
MAGTIYLLRNQQNGKGYVGQTTCPLDKRLNEHRNAAHNGTGKYLHRAIAKYGWENFHVSVLEENVDTAGIDAREAFWISILNTKAPNGYNLTDGGKATRGLVVSEQTRLKISTKAKSRIRKPHSLQIRQKMSRSQKGRVISEAAKQKMRENHADVSGCNNPMYGTSRKNHTLGNRHSEATKLKIAERTAKDYMVETPTGEIVQFSNLRQFCVNNRLIYHSMSLLRRGIISQHKKFRNLKVIHE